MKNNHGQALVEFILILPVFLMIVLCMIDFGEIFYTKYSLQNDLDLIVDLYKENKIDEYENYALNENLEIEINKGDSVTTITVYKYLDINTPFLSNILNNPYKVIERMTISNE